MPSAGRFAGKLALVTGASRGIGAAVALSMAEEGADLVINFRSKGPRGEELAERIEALGRRTLLAQADLTHAGEVRRMVKAVEKTIGSLDILVLNASGGLEKDRPAAYAMELNLTAQVRTLEAALPLMPRGGCIVFVTSHLAHFYGKKPVYAAYEDIAASKKAGEDALRSRLPELTARGIRFAVVSGDMIEGTITPKLLERKQRGVIETRRSQAGALPTISEFAGAIVDAAADENRPSGDTAFVGPID